jgi:hypothetical protein
VALVKLPRPLRSSDTAALEQRVADLEADVSELRRHNLRLAEITDVVQELLVPMASRDEERIKAALDRFNESL